MKKYLLKILCALLMAGTLTAGLAGCAKSDPLTPVELSANTATPAPAETAQDAGANEAAPGESVNAQAVAYIPVSTLYEAEDATLLGKARVESSMKGFSGAGYVTGLEQTGDACEFTINIEETGFYDLNFITSSGNHGYKENFVFVNGNNIGSVAVEGEPFQNSMIKRIYFEQGESKIKYEKSWGWVYLDSLEVVNSEPINPAVFDVSPKLINPNASDSAKRLMTYLTDIYGNYILSGQYCDLGLNGHEMFTLQKETGEKPAVLGLDLIEYTPSRVLNGSEGQTAERAIEFWEAGGIVTMCWHWNAPEDYLTELWYRGFYADATNIRLNKIMAGQDQNGYDLLLRDIDAIAEPLKQLQEADVPILWRPLHEASGGWFWWGAAGAEPYIELWKLVYDRLTNYHGLNNLIWLWNGQDAAWYPGGEYVDMIGEDIYAGERVYSSQIGKFMEILEYSGGEKMVVLSENGTLFDPELAVRDGAMWGFFATWSGEFALVSNNMNIYSEKYTEKSMLQKVYSHEKVLSLNDLPDLKTYEIKE